MGNGLLTGNAFKENVMNHKILALFMERKEISACTSKKYLRENALTMRFTLSLLRIGLHNLLCSTFVLFLHTGAEFCERLINLGDKITGKHPFFHKKNILNAL